jgi:hypothetical protein
MIRSSLNLKQKEALTKLLKIQNDMFIFELLYMPNISLEVVSYKLNVDPTLPLIR